MMVTLVARRGLSLASTALGGGGMLTLLLAMANLIFFSSALGKRVSHNKTREKKFSSTYGVLDTGI
jgi:hypothetical protein